MPAPDKLVAKTPGETPATPQEPTRLETIAAGDEDSVLAIIPELNIQELHDLQELELAGTKRDAVLAAVADELDARALLTPPEPPAPPSEAPAPVQTVAVTVSADQPMRTDTLSSPVLTEQGWLVPEPPAGAQPKAN